MHATTDMPFALMSSSSSCIGAEHSIGKNLQFRDEQTIGSLTQDLILLCVKAHKPNRSDEIPLLSSSVLSEPFQRVLSESSVHEKCHEMVRENDCIPCLLRLVQVGRVPIVIVESVCTAVGTV